LAPAEEGKGRRDSRTHKERGKGEGNWGDLMMEQCYRPPWKVLAMVTRELPMDVKPADPWVMCCMIWEGCVPFFLQPGICVCVSLTGRTGEWKEKGVKVGLEGKE
jgi:hypothetical protein